MEMTIFVELSPLRGYRIAWFYTGFHLGLQTFYHHHYYFVIFLPLRFSLFLTGKQNRRNLGIK
jgi:hypothetical protein